MNRLDQIIECHKAAGEKPWLAIKASNDKDLKYTYPDGAHYVSALTAEELADPTTAYANCGIWTDEGLTGPEIANFIANAKQDIPYLLAEIDRITKERDATIKYAISIIHDRCGQVVTGKQLLQWALDDVKDNHANDGEGS